MKKQPDKGKITALYERLSHDDERAGESVSIENQKRILEDYAQKNGFTNIRHFTDDGVRGTTFKRPGLDAMLEEIRAGNVAMHDFDTSMFFRWIFKSAFAILIVSNTWNIVMGVFDATQSVVNQSSGVIIGETSIHFDRLIPGLEFQLESMTIGSLLSLWFQTLVVGLTMNILSICIFLVTYGRMIEIYVVTALGPIPLATMGSSEWRSTGQNYLKSLLALGFQAFLIMIVVGIYAVLIRNISGAADIAGAIWGCMGYTVLLCFCLFKTGSISKSVFGAH